MPSNQPGQFELEFRNQNISRSEYPWVSALNENPHIKIETGNFQSTSTPLWTPKNFHHQR